VVCVGVSAALASGARAETPELVEGPAAIAYLNAQREANRISAFTQEEASLASWCPNERGGVGGGGNRVLSAVPYWDARISPWAPVPSAPAPFHQALIYDPVFTTVGEVNAEGPYDGAGPVINAACASVAGERLPLNSPEGAVFYSALGASDVPPAVIAFEDFTPAQALGRPEKTGPNLIAYAIPAGPHLRLPAAPHATVTVTLTSATGEAVPNIAAVAGEDCFIIVPPPLQPGTEYTGEALIAINASESMSDRLRFTTGPEELALAPTPRTPTVSPTVPSTRQPTTSDSGEPTKTAGRATRPIVTIRRVRVTKTKAHITVSVSQAGKVMFRWQAFTTTVKTLAAGVHTVAVNLTARGRAGSKHQGKVTLRVTLNSAGTVTSTTKTIRL